mgnify:CR=1 FL=1
MAKTVKELQQAFRERQAQRGLKRIDGWIHPDDMPKVKALMKELNEKRMHPKRK